MVTGVEGGTTKREDFAPPCNQCSKTATLECKVCQTPWCSEACGKKEEHTEEGCKFLRKLKGLAREATRGLSGSANRDVSAHEGECPVCLEALPPASKNRRYFYCCSTFCCATCAKDLRAHSRSAPASSESDFRTATGSE